MLKTIISIKIKGDTVKTINPTENNKIKINIKKFMFSINSTA